MAEKEEKKEGAKKGGEGAAPKKKKHFKQYAKHRTCPKCGSGVRLAEHADRLSCGKCGYYEKK